MARLRDPEGGCPWDLKQTHTTLRRYVLEEAYEVAEAIDRDDPDALCDELGDLLLQVVFHAQLATETGDFTLRDVCAAIVTKLIRRHPHIFGDTQADTSDAVLQNWNAIKAAEKAEKGIAPPQSILDGVVKSLPALSQALEISKRAVAVGFEWPDPLRILDKVDEELAELRAEVAAGTITPQRIADELGDVLFTLVNIARKFAIEPEDALRTQLTRFTRRFQYMETHAQKPLDALTLPEWEVLWAEAKQEEREKAFAG
jgi:MazG family protein